MKDDVTVPLHHILAFSRNYHKKKNLCRGNDVLAN